MGGRVHRRSGLTFAQIARIMQSQATRAARLAAADDVIHNGAEVTLAALQRQVHALHTTWQTLAAAQAGGAPGPRPSVPTPHDESSWGPAYDSV